MTKPVKILLAALISIGWIINLKWNAMAFFFIPILLYSVPKMFTDGLESGYYILAINIGWLANMIVIAYPIFILKSYERPKSIEADVLTTVTIFAP